MISLIKIKNTSKIGLFQIFSKFCKTKKNSVIAIKREKEIIIGFIEAQKILEKLYDCSTCLKNSSEIKKKH